MATTESKLHGWKFESDLRNIDQKLSPRSRRGGDSLVLVRESGGLDVKAGDALLINDEDNNPTVVLVTSVRFGTDDFVVISIVYFMRLAEVENPPSDSVKQELFITGAMDKISVDSIIEKANVLNHEDFEKVVIDSSNIDVTYMCRRGYDTYYRTFTPDTDFNNIKNGLVMDSQSQLEFIRNFVVKPSYTPKTKSNLTSTSEKKLPTGITPVSQPNQKPAPELSSKPNLKSQPKPSIKSSTKREPKSKVSKPSSEPKRKSNRLLNTKLTKSSPEPKRKSDRLLNTVALKRKLREVVLSPSPYESGAEIEDSEDEDQEANGSPIEDNSQEGYSSDSSVEVKGYNGEDLNDGSDSESTDDSELILSSDEEYQTQTKYNVQGQGRPTAHNSTGIKIRGPRSFITEAQNSVDEGSLDTSNEVVNRLPCREDQFTEIFYTLESAIESESGTALYISGPPGTGKTVTIREVVKQLHKQSKIGNLPKFEYLEINGLKMLTPQSAYEVLWNKIDNRKVPINGVSAKLEEFFKTGKTKVPLIVLLDELDQIASNNQSILYNFFNWPTYDKSKLILLAVANTMDLPERLLTNKTSSRLGLARISFPGYTHEDLIKIIKTRLSNLQNDHVIIKNDSIEYASRRVASVSGDARRALKIIKRAVELAKESSSGEEKIQVLPQHINRAIGETTSSPVSNYILHLTFIGKLILVGILSKIKKSGLAENSLGDIIDEIKQIITLNSAKSSSQFVIEGENILDILYDDFIIRPKGFSFVLNELIEAGLILQQNFKTERNSIVKLNIPFEDITSVFKRENSLRFFASLVE